MLPARALFAIVVSLLALSPAAAQKEGQEAPDFEFEPTGGGGKITRDSLKGRYVILTFFRTTDADIRDILNELNRLHEKHSRRGVTIIAATSEDRQRADELIKELNLGFPVAYGVDGSGSVFRVQVSPQYYLIDPRSIVVRRGHPKDNLEEQLLDHVRRLAPVGWEPGSLERRLQAAQAAVDKGDIGRGYTAAKAIFEIADQNSPLRDQAKSVQDKAAKAAREWISQAKSAFSAERFEEAARRIAVIVVHFSGEEVALEAEREVTRMNGDARAKGLIRAALDNVRGEILNEEAAELEGRGQFIEAIAAFRKTIEKYEKTEAAKLAQAAVDRIQSDPAIQAKLQKQRREEQASRWLDLGDRYARVKMYERAREQYTKVIEQHGEAEAASRARQRLEKLPTPG